MAGGLLYIIDCCVGVNCGRTGAAGCCCEEEENGCGGCDAGAN